MESLGYFKRIAPLALGLGALVLAGCESTEGYSSEYPNGQPVYNSAQPAYTSGQPVYNTNQPVYADQYGRPVYQNGQPAYTGQVYSQYGQPAYAGQPVYAPTAADDYIYYPDTGVYFSPSLQLFVYRDGDHWARRREAPRGWRQGQSGVHVRIQGGPERHDDEIRRQYSRGWRRDRDRDGD